MIRWFKNELEIFYNGNFQVNHESSYTERSFYLAKVTSTQQIIYFCSLKTPYKRSMMKKKKLYYVNSFVLWVSVCDVNSHGKFLLKFDTLQHCSNSVYVSNLIGAGEIKFT